MAPVLALKGRYQSRYARVPYAQLGACQGRPPALCASDAERLVLANKADACWFCPWVNPPLKHRGHNQIRWAVTVVERLDIDDNFLAHFKPTFDGGRAHVRQQNDI